jgi:glycosyltransferase involved in cell wall biosynthesis
MRRVLVLSYHYPPIGGAGAQRPAKMVRYLADLGYASTVVTGPGEYGGRWTPFDRSLSADIRNDTDVRRIDPPEPLPSSAWRKRAERWLGVEERWARWWAHGLLETGRQATGDVDLIYAWMSPFETAAPAGRLARELRRPWVADLGDPWALDEMFVYPSGLHRTIDLARMRRLLGTAAAVVMSTREAAARLRSTFPEFRDKPVEVIPNGYDAADFEGSMPMRTDGVFRIVHTGYLHTELGQRHRAAGFARGLLGGAANDVDFLTRSHVFLLDAIDRLVERDPELGMTIEVHLAGVLSALDEEVRGRSGVVRMLGYLPHDETVALMRSADLLFLPMQDLPPGRRATIVPGKTYEYLASGRPILAAVPDGDARDILTEAGNALLCRPASVDCMERAIKSELRRTRAGRPPRSPRRQVVQRFEYRRLAEELTAVFDDVLARADMPQRQGFPQTSPSVGNRWPIH